jgi:hypothetical protein
MAGPQEKSWNVHDVKAFKADGYRLLFSDALDTGFEFKEVMKRTRSVG